MIIEHVLLNLVRYIEFTFKNRLEVHVVSEYLSIEYIEMFQFYFHHHNHMHCFIQFYRCSFTKEYEMNKELMMVLVQYMHLCRREPRGQERKRHRE